MGRGHRCAADGPVCSKVDRERGIDQYARSSDVRLLNVLERRRVRTTQAEISQNVTLSSGSSVEREIDRCVGGVCIHKRRQSIARYLITTVSGNVRLSGRVH